MTDNMGGLVRLLETSAAFIQSKAMFTAVNLGIFEELEKASTPLTANDVAKLLNLLSIDGTEAVLNTCAALGLLKRTAEGSNLAVYENTDVTQTYILKDSSLTMLNHLKMMDRTMSVMLSLEDAVQSGKCQWKRNHKDMGDNLDWEQVLNNESEEWCMSTISAMHSISVMASKFTATAFDLSVFPTICDLGGCSGAFLHQVARVYPNVKLSLFDLQRMIEMAPRFFPKDINPDRLQMLKGNFFKDPLPAANLYVISQILHDWLQNVERVKGLLTKIYNALPVGGGLLVLERLLTEDKSGPMEPLCFSLVMVSCQEGKEMTGSEYKQLLESVGFSDVQYKHGPVFGAVIGYKSIGLTNGY